MIDWNEFWFENCKSVLIDCNENRTKWSPKGEYFCISWKSELIDCLRNLMKVRSLGKTNFCLKFCWFSLKFGLSTQLGRRHCENNVPNWTLYSGKRLWHGNTLLNLAKQLLSHGAYPFLKFGWFKELYFRGTSCCWSSLASPRTFALFEPTTWVEICLSLC